LCNRESAGSSFALQGDPEGLAAFRVTGPREWEEQRGTGIVFSVRSLVFLR